MVVSTSKAAPASAKPAFASLVELVTKFTASPVFCPAEMALYTLSAISLAEMPVWEDRESICERSSSRGTSVVSAMVLTFAMASSKSTADTAAAVPIPTTAAERGIIVLPAAVSFPPMSFIFSPNELIAALDFAASFSSFFSWFSVEISSLRKASYFPWSISPFRYCSSTCSCASFNVWSFFLVSSAFSVSSLYFCANRSVLDGSSFNAFCTSFSCFCVVLMERLALLMALLKSVVSAPILTIIPFMSLAMRSPPLWYEKSTCGNKCWKTKFYPNTSFNLFISGLVCVIR